MKLWKRASGVFKDKHSLWLTTLTKKTALRNPDIEAAVIKATNHDEICLDYKNLERVYAWIRISPAYIKPLIWAITVRMEKTRSWVVALKGLVLMHKVFCCKVAAVKRIGRLPFDLSEFKDRHSHNEAIWGYNDFIRAYYTFLDQKSSFIFLHAQEKCKSNILPKIRDEPKPKDLPDSCSSSLMQDLVSLQTMQGLLDLLLCIKPETYSMDSYTLVSPLILEAMDCIVIEIFDAYSRICRAIALVLTRIYSACSTGTAEATLALKIMRKASSQSEQLSSYFQFCKDIGVPNAKDCSVVEPIPEDDIKELENILANGASAIFNSDEVNCKALIAADQTYSPTKSVDSNQQNCKSLVLAETHNVIEDDNTREDLKTIISSEWQVFEDDCVSTNPFLTQRQPLLALDPPSANIHAYNDRSKADELPDLISFE